jgi:ubiquinone/menaquinone biosynthesis C-methylase UbiE
VTDESHETVRESWGRYAERFASEAADADQRPSMRRLVELCALDPGSVVLDVATGAGFTAFAFFRAGCRVIASDPTHEMLVATKAGWRDRELPGEAPTVEAWAEALPMRDGSLDAVVSHRAPHQFADQRAFIEESFRVLRPGGVLGIADQSPPDGWEQWHNDVERLRDPTHERALSVAEWSALATDAGFEIAATDVVYQEHDLEEWIERVSCPPERAEDVRRTFANVPDPISDVYRTWLVDGRTRFRTPQCVLVARRP